MSRSKIIIFMFSILMISGCANNAESVFSFTSTRKQDEFAVINNPDLAVPPSYYLTEPGVREEKNVTSQNLTKEENKLLNKLNEGQN